MVFDERPRFYIADEPQNEPISARGCGVDEAEPIQVGVAGDEAERIRQDAQNESRHEGTDAVCIDFDRFLQMTVRGEGCSLESELDG